MVRSQTAKDYKRITLSDRRIQGVRDARLFGINRELAQKYMEEKFRTPRVFYGPWDIDRIKQDACVWGNRTRQLTFYIIVSASRHNPKISYPGCTSNLSKRLDQHNKRKNGGPPETRRMVGWRVIFRAELPAIRDYSGNDIKKVCQGRMMPECRIIQAIEVCRSKMIPYRFSKAIFDPTSQLYMPLIARKMRDMGIANPATDDTLHI